LAGLGLAWAIATIPGLVSILRDLKIAFPGFTLTKLVPKQKYEVMLGSVEHWSWFEFELRSDDVPGFELHGRYYLELASRTDLPDQEAAIRNSMFNRKELSRDELIALERMWVEMHPSDSVFVLVSSDTGRLSSERRRQPAYDSGMSNVYSLDGHDSEVFHLNRTSEKWVHLPDFSAVDLGYASGVLSDQSSRFRARQDSDAVAAVREWDVAPITLNAVWYPDTHSPGTYLLSSAPGMGHAWANVAVALEPTTLLIGTDGTTSTLQDLDWEPDINRGPPSAFGYLTEWDEAPVLIHATVRPLSGLLVARSVAPSSWEPTRASLFAPDLHYGRATMKGTGVLSGWVVDDVSHEDGGELVLQSDARRDEQGVWYKETTTLIADEDTEPFEGIRLDDWERIWQEQLLRDIGPVEVTFDRDAKGRLHVVKMKRAAH
jgi:hypothetical protein